MKYDPLRFRFDYAIGELVQLKYAEAQGRVVSRADELEPIKKPTVQ